MIYERAIQLIATSLHGKYPNMHEDILLNTIRKHFYLQQSDPAAGSHFDVPSIDDKVQRDIAGQAAVIKKVESSWGSCPPAQPLQQLFELLNSGNFVELKLRTTSYVDDFQGIPPTPVDQVARGLFELEIQTYRLILAMRSCPIDAQASVLAHLFSSIIRIHPFNDGNGRVARFVSQLAARHWGYNYILIPKVRNDPVWLDALKQAIDTDSAALAQQFALRLESARME